MDFTDGPIQGVKVEKLGFFRDERGWLTELFRHDEMEKDVFPVMSYISMTLPGVQRGPHEHREQTDYFVFFSSTFELHLWDGREQSPTYLRRMEVLAGQDEPMCVIVPPGVVHAYRNIGRSEGMVLNFPNRLYAGWKKKEPVDEIRYEDDPASPYGSD